MYTPVPHKSAVGADVGATVGTAVGAAVGAAVGVAVGVAVGAIVGAAVGAAVGESVDVVVVVVPSKAVKSSSNLARESRAPGFTLSPVYARMSSLVPFKVLYGKSTSMMLDWELSSIVFVTKIEVFLLPRFRNLITNWQSAAGNDVMMLNLAL